MIVWTLPPGSAGFAPQALRQSMVPEAPTKVGVAEASGFPVSAVGAICGGGARSVEGGATGLVVVGGFAGLSEVLEQAPTAVAKLA